MQRRPPETTLILTLFPYTTLFRSTGTGKTAAYALPIIQNLDMTKKGVQALVICPTRELAMQVEQEFIKYLKYIDGVKTACLYGGQDINKQMSAIRGSTKIVIGTTGRIIDHINRKSLWLNSLKNLVLDEADEMINMGFKEDIETILKVVNVDSNIHMFSATIDDKIREVAKKYMINPEEIILEQDALTVDNVDELAISLKLKMKPEATSRIINTYLPERSIVFCSTKKNVDIVTTYLKEKGHLVTALHSDIPQNERKVILSDFREGFSTILVATDVAARGLDIKELDLVINYDLPYGSENYVHRVGRTGRSGKSGIAISYVVGDESQRLDGIIAFTKSEIKYINIPREEDRKKEKLDLKTVTKELEKVDNADKVKIIISVGKKDNIRAKDILGSLAAHTAMPKTDVGHIHVEDDYSTVVIPKFYLNEVIKSMTCNEVKGVKVSKVEEYK